MTTKYPVIGQVNTLGDARKAIEELRRYFEALRRDDVAPVATQANRDMTPLPTGVVWQTPDGTKKYRVELDNSGNVVTVLL